MICRHSGNMGDLIYSLPTLIALSKKDLVDLVMVTGVRQSYSEPHPLGDIRLSPEWAEKLKPLLEAQPYLNTVSVIDQAEFQGCYDGAPVVNLDQFRRLEIDPAQGPAQRWFLWAHAEHFDLTLPTLAVRPDTTLAESWVVNRTSRNQNPFLDWRTLADLPCVFVGLPEEYQSLRRLLPSLRHQEVDDFLQLASLLAGARGFVGNQSFCFALAESLKIPRLLETPLSHANVFPVGGTAFEARTPMAWASALEELTQSRKRLDYEVKRPLPKVFFHQQDLTACSLYRVTMPAHYLAHLLTGRVACDLGPAIAVDNDYRAINLQRVVKGNFLTALKRFQAQGKLFLWDTDDLFTALPESNPAYRDVDEAVKEHLLEVAELADFITCTTPFLKGQLGHPHKTAVLPNLLDPHLYPPVKRDPGRPFTRILWAGSPSHDADLAQLEPVYHLLKGRYGERVQWVFMGYWPTWACTYERRPGESVARLVSRYKDVGFVRPVPLGQYPAALCDLAPDIAVCPLADCVFNRCKSGIKAQEMTLAGAAVVASPLEPYTYLGPGRTGLFATEDPADWVSQLGLLIENPGLRAELQVAALAQIHKEFSWWSEDAVRPWVEFYGRLAEGGDLHRAGRLCDTESLNPR